MHIIEKERCDVLMLSIIYYIHINVDDSPLQFLSNPAGRTSCRMLSQSCEMLGVLSALLEQGMDKHCLPANWVGRMCQI